MTLWREFSTPPTLSRERERGVLTPNWAGSVRVCFVGFCPHQPTCARNAIFGTIYIDMCSLSLKTTLLKRLTYAGDGMGVDAFCIKEVA